MGFATEQVSVEVRDDGESSDNGGFAVYHHDVASPAAKARAEKRAVIALALDESGVTPAQVSVGALARLSDDLIPDVAVIGVGLRCIAQFTTDIRVDRAVLGVDDDDFVVAVGFVEIDADI